MGKRENENEGEISSVDNYLGSFAVKRITKIQQCVEVDVGSIMGEFISGAIERMLA